MYINWLLEWLYLREWLLYTSINYVIWSRRICCACALQKCCRRNTATRQYGCSQSSPPKVSKMWSYNFLKRTHKKSKRHIIQTWWHRRYRTCQAVHKVKKSCSRIQELEGFYKTRFRISQGHDDIVYIQNPSYTPGSLNLESPDLLWVL
jgi:hypothetical protein